MSSTGRAVDLSASEGLQGIEAELNRVIGSLEIASNRGLLTPRETSRRASVTFLGQSSHAKRLSAAAYAKAIYELGLSVSAETHRVLISVDGLSVKDVASLSQRVITLEVEAVEEPPHLPVAWEAMESIPADTVILALLSEDQDSELLLVGGEAADRVEQHLAFPDEVTLSDEPHMETPEQPDPILQIKTEGQRLVSEVRRSAATGGQAIRDAGGVAALMGAALSSAKKRATAGNRGDRWRSANPTGVPSHEPPTPVADNGATEAPASQTPEHSESKLAHPEAVPVFRAGECVRCCDDCQPPDVLCGACQKLLTGVAALAIVGDEVARLKEVLEWTWARRDTSRLEEVFSSDAVMALPQVPGSERAGLSAIVAGYQEAFSRGEGLTLGSIAIDGDAVWWRYQTRGPEVGTAEVLARSEQAGSLIQHMRVYVERLNTSQSLGS